MKSPIHIKSNEFPSSSMDGSNQETSNEKGTLGASNSAPLSPSSPPSPPSPYTASTDVSASCSNICWRYPPDEPWSPKYYLTIRGGECLATYAWILKDLAWTQDWYWMGFIFGSAALCVCTILLFHAASLGNINEVWIGMGQFLWLFGNIWWMSGELHDNQYPDEPPIYDERTLEAGYVLKTALIVTGLYVCIIKPSKILNKYENKESLSLFDTTGLVCRFPQSIFSSWRDYENTHILFWTGKDCAWNALIPSMWFVFTIPTLFIAFDFCVTSFFTNRQGVVIDHAHYTAILLWVSANLIWAFGELYFPDYDDPQPLDGEDPDAIITARFWSSWTLLGSLVPLFMLYVIWFRATLLGRAFNRIDDVGGGGAMISSGDQRPVSSIPVHSIQSGGMATTNKVNGIDDSYPIPLYEPHNKDMRTASM